MLEHGANPDLLCGRNSLSFLAPMVAEHSHEQEKAWVYTKEAYDLLKKFGANFNAKNSLTGETLEEHFRSLLPSSKLKKIFK